MKHSWLKDQEEKSHFTPVKLEQPRFGQERVERELVSQGLKQAEKPAIQSPVAVSDPVSGQKTVRELEERRDQLNQYVFPALHGGTKTKEASKPYLDEWVDVSRKISDSGEKRASFGELSQYTVHSGLNEFNKGGASTLDFLAPTDFLGKYDPFSNLNDFYTEKRDTWNRKLEDSLENRGDMVRTAVNLGKNTVSALPNALLAMMTGGGSAVSSGTAALNSTSAAAGTSGLWNSIGTAARTLVKDPLYWSSMLQTLGRDYEENKVNGASDLEAGTSALISSALNAGIEVKGGNEILPALFRKGGNRGVTQWIRGMLEEGGEQDLQSIVSGITQRLIYDHDKKLYSDTDESAVVHPGRLARDFGTGAAVGGILGGTQLGLLSVLDGVSDYAGNRTETMPFLPSQQDDTYQILLKIAEEMDPPRSLSEVLEEIKLDQTAEIMEQISKKNKRDDARMQKITKDIKSGRTVEQILADLASDQKAEAEWYALVEEPLERMDQERRLRATQWAYQEGLAGSSSDVVPVHMDWFQKAAYVQGVLDRKRNMRAKAQLSPVQPVFSDSSVLPVPNTGGNMEFSKPEPVDAWEWNYNLDRSVNHNEVEDNQDEAYNKNTYQELVRMFTNGEVDENSPEYKTVDDWASKTFDREDAKAKKEQAIRTYGITDDEARGINSFVDGSAYTINQILRGELDDDSEGMIDAWVEHTTSGLEKHPKFEGRTYRNIGFYELDEFKAFMEKHAVGKDVSLDAFSSASKEDANGYIVGKPYVVHMVIDGVSGCDISDSFGIPWQKEVIYLPGTILHIDSVKMSKDGHILMYAREVKKDG